MAKTFACALTHVRHESFFLQKWIAHYGAIVGRENLFIVIDGDDWQPDVDLTGISVEVVHDAPRRRLRNDQWIAKVMSARANALRRRYEFVIRVDADEYVTIDPDSKLDWPDAMRELGETGYIFAMGIDVVQAPDEGLLDRGKPILGQRQFGFVSNGYSKPFVISRWNNWAGGAHRLINRKVRLSNHFFLFHTALADMDLAHERMMARGGHHQHASHLVHQRERLGVLDTVGGETQFAFDAALEIGHREFSVELDGSPAARPRAATVEGASNKGLFTAIPKRFHGLV